MREHATSAYQIGQIGEKTMGVEPSDVTSDKNGETIRRNRRKRRFVARFVSRVSERSVAHSRDDETTFARERVHKKMH